MFLNSPESSMEKSLQDPDPTSRAEKAMVSGWFDPSSVDAPVAHKIQPHKSKLQQFISCHNNMFTHEINQNDAWYLGYMLWSCWNTESRIHH